MKANPAAPPHIRNEKSTRTQIDTVIPCSLCSYHCMNAFDACAGIDFVLASAMQSRRVFLGKAFSLCLLLRELRSPCFVCVDERVWLLGAPAAAAAAAAAAAVATATPLRTADRHRRTGCRCAL